MPIDADHGPWIQTASHHKFYPFNPQPEDIFIEDIAHHLSNICRFTGASRCLYGVAQHSALVSRHCSPENKLWGLLHDSSEAYISDLASPIKRSPHMTSYRALEAIIMEAVCIRFGLPFEEPEEVKEIDKRAAITEATAFLGPLLPGWPIEGVELLPEHPFLALSPEKAEELFLIQYFSLQRNG